jgi:hypothetical protein
MATSDQDTTSPDEKTDETKLAEAKKLFDELPKLRPVTAWTIKNRFAFQRVVEHFSNIPTAIKDATLDEMVDIGMDRFEAIYQFLDSIAVESNTVAKWAADKPWKSIQDHAVAAINVLGSQVKN